MDRRARATRFRVPVQEDGRRLRRDMEEFDTFGRRLPAWVLPEGSSSASRRRLHQGAMPRMNPTHRDSDRSAGLQLFQEFSTLGQQVAHTVLLRHRPSGVGAAHPARPRTPGCARTSSFQRLVALNVNVLQVPVWPAIVHVVEPLDDSESVHVCRFRGLADGDPLTVPLY